MYSVLFPETVTRKISLTQRLQMNAYTYEPDRPGAIFRVVPGGLAASHGITDTDVISSINGSKTIGERVICRCSFFHSS